jgi:hypothetical protein
MVIIQNIEKGHRESNRQSGEGAPGGKRGICKGCRQIAMYFRIACAAIFNLSS